MSRGRVIFTSPPGLAASDAGGGSWISPAPAEYSPERRSRTVRTDFFSVSRIPMLPSVVQERAVFNSWYEGGPTGVSMTTITLEQIINFLLETPMFGDLNAAELSQIVHIMQVQRVRDGHAVFREGDAGDAWYVIFDGVADVTKDAEFLPARRIARLGARACFGEMAILDHTSRSASVVAHGELTLFRFPRREFEELLADGNLAAYKLIYEMAKVMAQRQRTTTQQLTNALSAHPDRLHQTTVNVLEGHSVSE